VQAGAVAPVGAVVAVIAGAGGAVAEATKAAAPAAAPQNRTPSSAAAPVGAGQAPGAPVRLRPFFRGRTPPPHYRPAKLPRGAAVTPLARRLASDAGIDLTRLKGSGPHGRIVARDVEAAADVGRAVRPAAPAAPPHRPRAPWR